MLYRYFDPYQPGVTFPHVALWYAPGQTLSCDWGIGVGVGIHPLMDVPYEIHRPKGVS